MSLVTYQFSFTGRLTPTTVGEHLKMANGITADVGYTIPRSFYVASIAVSWRGGSLTDSFRVALTKDNVDLGLEASIEPADLAGGYKVVAPVADLELVANDHLGCYAEADALADYLEDLMVVVELTSVSTVGSDDEVLPNIVVTTADLADIKPNIAQYLLPGEVDFSKIILQEKRVLYSDIKLQERQNYEGYTNEEIDDALENIKDLPKEENLKTRLKYAVVGRILFYNRLYDEAEQFTQFSKSVPLQYHVDEDEDDEVDDGERMVLSYPTFGR